MLFNSIAFAVFLPIVFILYWALPHKYRWILLLAASYYFYMSWDPRFIVLIVGDTAVAYIAARLLEKTEAPGKRKLILGLSVGLCFAVLFVFKYLNFFTESVTAVLRLFTLPVNAKLVELTLPVGISFYTFQAVSYVIDVYRGKVRPEHHFGIFATFISFFPQLVAGPIERTENLLPQINSEKKFNYEEASYGLRLMMWGFFKKLCVADVLAIYVDHVYNNLAGYTGFALVLATFFFTLQIYCDFSGYSDIAIGTAKLMGVNLMTNFDSPYFSSSIHEFWSRWHISLSTWFRDYVYIPLGGNRKGKFRTYVNLMITFLVSGLWHGANWTFVLWGAVHGLGQVVERLLPFNHRKKALPGNEAAGAEAGGPKVAGGSGSWIVTGLKTLVVFLFVMAAWIFFRANSVQDACYVFTHLFQDAVHLKGYISFGLGLLGLTHFQIFRILFTVLILTGFDFAARKTDPIAWLGRQKAPVRIGITGVILIVIMLLFATTPAEFVYFQF